MQIKTNRKSGFTLVEIMIVVAIIGLLAAIAIPNFVRAREQAQLQSIMNNLRIIDGAKDQYALEEKQPGTTVVAIGDLEDTYIKGGVKQVLDETYVPLTVGEASSVTLASAIGDVAAGDYTLDELEAAQ